MTLDNRVDWDGSVYGSAIASSTELMLQPYASRHQVMKTAWTGMLGFMLMAIPFTILPTFLVTFFGLAILSTIAPRLQNHPLTLGAIMLLWSAAFLTIALLTWKAIEDSGYKTFSFDRVQKQLVINTATIIGRKVVKTIPFAQIHDAQWHERQHKGISMSVFLVLAERRILGVTHPNKIILSSFGSLTSARTVKILTANKHHQELLFLVRDALGLSTQEIADRLERMPSIPTEEELQQQQSQAIADARASLKKIAKLTFASQESKSADLELLRSQVRNYPEDPQNWEQLAQVLSLQKNPSKDEVIDAYRKAELLYLDRGNAIAAAVTAQTLKKLVK
jgi:hypothetical protein